MSFKITLSINILLTLLFASCKNSEINTNSPTPEKLDLKEYVAEPIEGTNRQMVTKFNAQGILIEQGFVENGLKCGAWYTFYAEKGRIQEIWNYESGKKNGLHVVMNNSGRVDLYESYLDDIPHGKKATFKMGTPVEEMTYYKGQLHGMFRGFAPNGRLQRIGNFKNGKQDGQYFVYDENGKVILSAKYANGVVVD